MKISVWSVNFNVKTLSWQNYFLQRVWGGGGVHKTFGNSGGVGSYFCIQKNGNSGEKGGLA